MPSLQHLKNTGFSLVIILFLSILGCKGQNAPESLVLLPAANRTAAYFPMLQDKNFAVVANQTSVLMRENDSPVHLVDSLTNSGLRPQLVFAPEHGFRGQADAGEHVADGVDTKTGLQIISLYGSNRKPKPEQLAGLDLVLFDIQDVGVRFYTYIATLQLVMEACAEAGIPVVVLDRPNPNISFVDGPVMEEEHQGFLGMTPIPLVYGMSIGEYAEMINGEGWLAGGQKASLTVIPIADYRRSMEYTLPVPPSPNLPNQQAVLLYPSLGLFEGTRVNAGRGTSAQFQRFGAPFLNGKHFDFRYKPAPNAGAKNPKHNGEECIGKDLSSEIPPKTVDLQWIIEAFQNREEGSEFFITSGFTRHAGTTVLQQQIESGMSWSAIRQSWQPALEEFNAIRVKYLRYPD